MLYSYIKPNKQLTEYIKTVLIADADSEQNYNSLPLYTSGMPALLCVTERLSNKQNTILQLTLYCNSVPADVWDVKNGQTAIAYFFKPFSLPAIFDVSASKLAKNPIDLSNWNAFKTNALKTQLTYAISGEEKIAALDNILTVQLEQQKRGCDIIHFATDYIMINSGSEGLSSLLNELKLNERSFQRMFKKYVGITPSHFRRICQFKSSFQQVKSGAFEKLTDVAYQAGFSDQSHFSRSFKEFTQTTPKDYIKSGLKRKET